MLLWRDKKYPSSIFISSSLTSILVCSSILHYLSNSVPAKEKKTHSCIFFIIPAIVKDVQKRIYFFLGMGHPPYLIRCCFTTHNKDNINIMYSLYERVYRKNRPDEEIYYRLFHFYLHLHFPIWKTFLVEIIKQLLQPKEIRPKVVLTPDWVQSMVILDDGVSEW